MWAVHAVGQLLAGDRDFERCAFHVGPGVRLVRLARVEHLFDGRAGEPGVDAGELCERLDRAHGDLAGRDPRVKLDREFQDPQVLAHARLSGLQALGDALHGQAGVEQALIPPGAGEGIEVAAQIVFEQRFDEEVGVLVLVAGAGRADDRRQLHHARLHSCPVSALAGDQHVVAVIGRTDPDRLQTAVGADRVGELLELAVVNDVPARVERVRDDDPR